MTDNLRKFDHLVVLMLENRSFDNLLGYLYENEQPEKFIPDREQTFRGIPEAGTVSNPNASKPPKAIPFGKAPHRKKSDFCRPFPDPGEGYAHTCRQLFGHEDVDKPASELPEPPMDGFVRDYIGVLKKDPILFWPRRPKEKKYNQVMHGYTPEALPMLSQLAKEYAVSDAWFSSVPSQTMCNRSFVNAANSHGFVNNSDYVKWLENKGVTIFERLSEKFEKGKDWRVYWDRHDVFSLTKMSTHRCSMSVIPTTFPITRILSPIVQKGICRPIPLLNRGYFGPITICIRRWSLICFTNPASLPATI